MIITNTVEITIKPTSINHYKNIGYDIKYNDKITVPINHLPKNSHYIIEIKCDGCNRILKMKYIDYTKYVGNNGLYKCNKCNSNKRKETCLNRYGVDSVVKIDEVKRKMIETNLKKYGVENPFQNEEVKDKIKETNMIKYGVENVMFNELIKSKIKKIFIDKYGVENPFQNEEVKNKIRETNMIKYGGHPMNCDEIKNKLRNTFLKRFGVENPNNSLEVLEKSKQTRINKGNQISDEFLTDWELYRKNVKIITYKNKKLLYENWNGFDYYDGEYIKENKCYKNKNYPTIDHKISIQFGFVNNILPSVIGDLNNLCITKKSINSSKNKKCHY